MRSLRLVFQTLPLTRGNAADRCDFHNNEWTFGDGFQFLRDLGIGR